MYTSEGPTVMARVLRAVLAVAVAAAWSACPDANSGSDVESGVDVQAVDITDTKDAALDDVPEDTSADTAHGDGDGDAYASDASVETETSVIDCAPYGYDFNSLVPGPCQEGFDADLAALAHRYERSFHVFSAASMGGNADVTFALADTTNRAAIESFLDGDSWDFQADTGLDPVGTAAYTGKITGLYAGVGIASDAFRYAVLRDQGYPADEVERARRHLVDGLELLHTATAITGMQGGLARSVARVDIPGVGQTPPTPLFATDGAPLPEPKSNGTWRVDNSVGGQFPGVAWEDSCSRDMALGWATAYGVAWEVIADDPTVDAALKARLRADAKAIGDEFSTVRANGYDLEIYDPDGRRTKHGCFHEFNIDCGGYTSLLPNGFHAIMALGMMGALAFASGDAALASYVIDDLVDARGLPDLALEDIIIEVDMGHGTNFSGINMMFGGAFLALRYVDDVGARAKVRQGVAERIYHRKPADPWHPADMKQSLFDFVYAFALTEGSAFSEPVSAGAPDAVARGLATLAAFPSPPYWNTAVTNCPEAVCDCDNPALSEATKTCVLSDGSSLELLGCRGWNCQLVAATPVPKAVRPPSNYDWRSNPYAPNGGGDGSSLNPGVDFRFAYWLARYTSIP